MPRPVTNLKREVGVGLTILFTLLLAAIGCQAAPPYVPAPVANAASLGWNASPDATVTGYNVYAWPPGATNWTKVFGTAGTNAPGILTNAANATAWCVTATNNVGESLPSNQVTNTVNTAPAPAGRLMAN